MATRYALPLIAAGLALAVAGSAAAAGTVVIYNATEPNMAQKVVAGFKKKVPGIEVEMINSGVGELMTRIEGEKARPRGDVFFGASVEAFDSAIELFAPYKTKEDAKFDRAVVAPGQQYYGFSMPLQAFIINRKLLPGDSGPKSWKDLADPQYKGKIILANPALSGSSYAQLAQMLQLHDWNLVQKIVQNTTYVTSSKLVYQNVAKGEMAIGVTGDYTIAEMKEKGFPVDCVYPSEGTGLRFDAIGIIKGGPNFENAKIFVDYANTAEAHEIMVQESSRRSVRKDVTAPKGQIPTANVPTFPYDPKKAAANRDANLAKFEEYFSKK